MTARCFPAEGTLSSARSSPSASAAAAWRSSATCDFALRRSPIAMPETWFGRSKAIASLKDTEAIHPPMQGDRGILLRVSRLVEEVDEITELDLNPVFAMPPGQGCGIVDARIRAGPVASRAGLANWHVLSGEAARTSTGRLP